MPSPGKLTYIAVHVQLKANAQLGGTLDVKCAEILLKNQEYYTMCESTNQFDRYPVTCS